MYLTSGSSSIIKIGFFEFFLNVSMLIGNGSTILFTGMYLIGIVNENIDP